MLCSRKFHPEAIFSFIDRCGELVQFIAGMWAAQEIPQSLSEFSPLSHELPFGWDSETVVAYFQVAA